MTEEQENSVARAAWFAAADEVEQMFVEAKSDGNFEQATALASAAIQLRKHARQIGGEWTNVAMLAEEMAS